MRKRFKKLLSLLCVVSLLLSGGGDLGLNALAEQNPVVLVRELTASDGLTYVITLICQGENDGFPEKAELTVSELQEDDEGYADYVALSAEKLGERAEDLPLARAFSISITDPSTGETLQPNQNVKVSIQLLNEDLNDYSEIDVVHFHGEPGDAAELMTAGVNGDAVEFTTDGFSVYVLLGSGGEEVPLWTYTFEVWDRQIDTYVQYGAPQSVKNGEKPMVPVPPSPDEREFAGWYIGHYDSNENAYVLDEPYDFDNIPAVTEAGGITLYAKYADFAYVVFHDQYNGGSDTFPVAFTRREELTGAAGSEAATVRIDDLSAAYTGSEGMAFCGWSYTPIKTPGVYRDPDTTESYVIGWEEDDEDKGKITVTGETHLYPVYRPIHWLTFYTAQSGMGASYVPTMAVFDGDGVAPPLPATSRDGYYFQGWFTGTLVSDAEGNETVNYGSQIAYASGELVTGASDGGVTVSFGKLQLSADVTLYAKWGATYNVVIWKQSPADAAGLPDEDKTYEYHRTVTLEAEIGTSVSVGEEYRGYGGSPGYENYVFGRCDNQKTIGNAKAVTVLNVYYDLDPGSTYAPDAAAEHTLFFVDSVAGAGGSAMPDAINGIHYGEKLSELPGYPIPAPASERRSEDGREVYHFGGWFMDQACTIRADLSAMTMPDHDLTLYAGWSPEWFIVNIDPNYGALYSMDGGVLKGSGSTWFWQTYDSEPIGEYTHAVRDYVASSSGSYYYVRRDRSYYGYSGNQWDNSEPDRQTFFTTDISKATEDTTFEYAPGSYSYIGWYEVFPDGTEAGEPYDFTYHTDHDTTLRLRWKRTGMFYLGYDAGDGELEDQEKTAILPDACADHAGITLNRTALAPGGYSFVGWRVKADPEGPVFTPGEVFTLNDEDAVRESGKDVIWLEAVYARTNTVTVVYHPNGGTVNESELDYGSRESELPGGGSEPVSGIVTGGNAVVTGLANNARYTLSSGQGFSRENAVLAGWSDREVCTPEAELYSLGGEYGVDSVGSETDLYAVWQVTVTYHLNSTEADWGAGDWSGYEHPAADTYSQTVYVGNAVQEPAGIPCHTGAGSRMFYHWRTAPHDPGTAENDDDVYDFSQPVTGALALYAYWDGPIEVPVHVLDASGQVLTEVTGAAGWTTENILAGADAVSLPGTGYVTAPADYELAFAAAHSTAAGLQTISEEEKVTSIFYDQTEKHLRAVYADGSSASLDEGTEIYYVYYRKKPLDIRYRSMDAAGVLSPETPAAPAPTGTVSLLGEYDVTAGVTQPMDWVSGSFACYAYAIGDENAENASRLQMITTTSSSDDVRPSLLVKNSWRGFRYSTDGGSSWSDCGYDPALYVIYFVHQPTIIMFHEETVGSGAVMDTGFEYRVQVTQTVDGIPDASPVYDSDDNNGNVDLYLLKSGEAQSAVLFYSNAGGSETVQTITVTQKDTPASSAFTTLIGEAEQKTWSCSSTAAGGTQNVTFTNRHKSLSVEVHVAMLENGSVVLGDEGYRSGNYSFDLALGESADILTKLSPNALFTDPSDTFTFGAVAYGSDDGSTVLLEGSGLSSVSYSQLSGSLYEVLLDGDPQKALTEFKVYYLYYPIPRVRYVKDTGSGLEPVMGSLNGSDAIPSITYDRGVLHMNGAAVEQDQRLSIPANGVLTISQSGNHFRMPPNLDDGVYARYLTYSGLGAGDAGSTDLSGVSVGPGRTMYLRVQKDALQFSFTGTEDDWTPFTGIPTVYAIYEERGYDLLISKTVDLSDVGAESSFIATSFRITVFSEAITKDSYAVEGYESETIAADPDAHTITLPHVTDGTSIRIKSLGQGSYTFTETGNENFVLTAKSGHIVGGTLQNADVTSNSSVALTLDSEKRLDLMNTPRKLCKIVDAGTEHVFYTFADAMKYVEDNVPTLTARVEMLSDYLVPASDAAEIPNGFRITLTTADSGEARYEGSGKAVITRGSGLTGAPLITSNGRLTLENVILDGAGLAAAAPLIRSADDLTVGTGSELKNAVHSGNGGAIYASAGNITVDGGVIGGGEGSGNRASGGGAIYYTGSGTIALRNDARISGNTADTGDGGGIYAAQGTVLLSGSSSVSGNRAPEGHGGGICVGNAVLEIGQNAGVTGNTAKVGGGIYADTAAVTISATEGVLPPSISNNTAASGHGGGFYIDKGSVTVSGGSLSGNRAPEGFGGAIWAGSAAVSVSGETAFSSNSAQSGGAVYAGTGAVTVTDGSLNNNGAFADGGAIYASGGSVTLTGVSLTGNLAANGSGGAVYAGTGAVSVTGGSLRGNQAPAGNGGAVYADRGSVTISGGTLGGTETADANRARNGGAVYAGMGEVTLTDSCVSGNAASQSGGAIYAGSGKVQVAMSGGGSLSGNRAAAGDGGAIFAGTGAVTVSDGSITENTAASGDGGAVYAGTGAVTLTSCTAVTGNTAAGNGGVVCADSSAVTVSGCSFGGTGTGAGNSAANGGAVYAGTGNVSVTENSSLKGNRAAQNGGAICTDTGSVIATNAIFGGDETGEGNSASAGGAIYSNKGTVSLTGSSVVKNSATTDGGGIYAEKGGVTLAGTPMTGNTATGGNGGAFYAGAGAVNISGIGALTENSAKNGGAFYMGSGVANLTSVSVQSNTTTNGSAIFVNEGTINFNAGTVTLNVSTNGGGVGVGSITARLYLTGDVQITGNTSDGNACNLYLDQDAPDIINISGLGTGARIGVYVPASLTNKRDVPGARFAVYTSDTNISDTTIKNDHANFNFSVGKDSTAKKLYWAKNIRVEVCYLPSFAGGLPSAINRGASVKYITSYCPIIDETGTVALSELANDVYNKYSDLLDKNNTANNKLHTTSIYGGAFAYGDGQYGEDITRLVWDSEHAKWTLQHRNGTTSDLADNNGDRRIYIIYAEPTYISVENNTANSLTVSELSLSAAGFTDQPVINSSSQVGYGMLFAKNGAIRSALLPVTEEDFSLAAGDSLMVLFPGGQGMTCKLNGSFTNLSGASLQLRRGTTDPLDDETLYLKDSGEFDKIEKGEVETPAPLTDVLPSSTATYQIIFGEDKHICKVVHNGEEKRFSKISVALEYIRTNQLKGTYENPTAIEMLTDYLLRASDPVSIPQGYNIKLTTAVDGEYHYPYDTSAYDSNDPTTHPRAIISRDAENTEAMISASFSNANLYTSLTVEYLVFDGKGIKGNTKGGAIQSKHCQVTARYMDVKNIYAENGGGIYAEGHLEKDHSIVTVEHCSFTSCNSTKTGGRNGGGAIHAYTRELYVSDSDFDACIGDWQAGAVFHRIDDDDKNKQYNGKPSTAVVERCRFTNCTAQAAGGLELDSVDITVEDCEFRHCIGTVRNGGGFNIYVCNIEEPNFACSTSVRNCIFDDCRMTTNETAENRGNGGGFRCNSKTIIMENCSFTNTIARKGGAVCFKNANATATISGCTISGCSAVDYGGGVYAKVSSLTIGDYGSKHTSITNCTTPGQGGGVYHNKDGGTFCMTNATISGNSTTGNAGGGIYTNASTVSITGGSVSNNTSKNQGGGIYQNKNGTFTMTGTTVNDNTTTNSTGGGIHTVAKTVTITGGSISNNKSSQDGGGLYSNAQTSLTIRGTSISGNTSSSKSGGGVWYDGADDGKRESMKLTIQGCSIDRNSANYGGGVYTQVKTVTIEDYSYTDTEGNLVTAHASISNNTAKNNGGGLYHSREIDGARLEITNAAIDGNRITASGKLGGGVYTNVRTLTITGGSISNNTATNNGGGVWYDSSANSAENRALMTLTLSGCAIDGNYSDNNGGGIYTQVKSVTLRSNGDTQGSLSGNQAAKNGGGLYQDRNIEGSSLSITDTVINNNWARGGSGGGVFTNVAGVTLTGAGFSRNDALSDGGGLCHYGSSKPASLTVQGASFSGNTSGGSGGAIHTNARSLVLGDRNNGGAITHTTISGCVASGSGGAVHHNNNAGDASTTLTDCTVENCRSENASGGGGAVFSNAGALSLTGVTLRGNTAAGKGGGVDYEYQRAFDPVEPALGGLTADACTVSGNTAGMGGGIYTRSFMNLRGGSSVTGNRLSGNVADHAAGVYLIDGMTLVVGRPDAVQDTVNVIDNYTDTGAPSNLRLWSNSDGQNNVASVQVNCNLSGVIRVVNANKVGTQFGSWAGSVDESQSGLLIDASDAVFKADYDTFYGGINRSDLTRKQIIWVGPAICKLTDAEGNLLYLRTTTDGEGNPKGTDAAIFDKLDDGNADGSITSAFNLLRNPAPELYREDGSAYTGQDFCVKMLDSFTTESPIVIKHYDESPDRSITFTTAGRGDADYPYEYNKTYPTRGDTATVMRGAGVGNNHLVNAEADLSIGNLVLDGGSLNGLTAQRNTRLLNVDQEGITVTLQAGAMLQNAELTGSGGGVCVNRGTLVIGDDGTGVIAIRNCSAENGGAVYATENATVEFKRGNIIQCRAANDGGGIYLKGGSGTGVLWMAGGTIERCTAGSSGGGLFVGNHRTLHMYGTGSRITGNSAASQGGGIAVGGADTRLYFSQIPTVTGNTSAAAGGKACNLELPFKDIRIINTEAPGLYNSANIGVYVPGEEGTGSCYDDHGLERTPFGSYDAGSNTKTFYSFINDRNGLKGGLMSGSEGIIYWVKIFSLEISKTVLAGETVPAGEEFTFLVRLEGEATVPGQPSAKEIEGEYGGMLFHSDGVSATTATVVLALRDGASWETGVSVTGENLSYGLRYTVTEQLSPAQKARYAALPAQYTGMIGENNRVGLDIPESEQYISRVPFLNVLPVCKLTDGYGNLLYYRYRNESRVPAVYTSLQSAVDALRGDLYSGIDLSASKYDISQNGIQIQMLVEAYPLSASVTLPETLSLDPGKTVTLTSAAESDADYPYRGRHGTVATIRRAFDGDSMFTVNKALTVVNLSLNGAKDSHRAAGNGGIFRVVNGGSLSVGTGAVLEQSCANEQGGAVYVASGGTLTVTDGTVQANESRFGGAVYAASGGTVSMSGGTIRNNRANKTAASGNGAGIYLAAGSTLNLSGSPRFGSSTDGYGNISQTQGNLAGSLIAQKNGGKTYHPEHQDIYLEESVGDPGSLVLTGNLTGAPGSIWVWADGAERYGMAAPFARVDFGGDIAMSTYKIFRNAQTDFRTCVSDNEYLTGDEKREKDGFIHWTGGYDVYFVKRDGFGERLPGAVFTLYTDAACSTPFDRNGTVTAASADGTSAFQNAAHQTLPTGTVLFDKLPAGVYYMKETVSPEGYVNALPDSTGTPVPNRYVLLVGKAKLEEWDDDFGLGAVEQAEQYAAAERFADYGVKRDSYAIFLLDGDSASASFGKALANPDIAVRGVMNVSRTRRRAILKKIDSAYNTLEGAEFDILRYDRTLLAHVASNRSGVFWTEYLPFGTYYVHETLDSLGNAVSLWYTVSVSDTGVSCSLQSATEPPPKP